MLLIHGAIWQGQSASHMFVLPDSSAFESDLETIVDDNILTEFCKENDNKPLTSAESILS